MVVRLRAVRWSSESLLAGAPLTTTSPAVGGSNRPQICSRVDFPAPDGPIRATSSPGLMASETSWTTSSRPEPCWKLRVTFWRANTGSLIAKGLDRIEPRRTPGGVKGGEKRENKRHDHDDRHFTGIHDRRQLGQEIDGVGKQLRAQQVLHRLADRFDVIGEGKPETETGRRAGDPDAGPAQQEDAHDHSAGRAHGAQNRDVASLVLHQHDLPGNDIEGGHNDD